MYNNAELVKVTAATEQNLLISSGPDNMKADG